MIKYLLKYAYYGKKRERCDNDYHIKLNIISSYTFKIKLSDLHALGQNSSQKCKKKI